MVSNNVIYVRSTTTFRGFAEGCALAIIVLTFLRGFAPSRAHSIPAHLSTGHRCMHDEIAAKDLQHGHVPEHRPVQSYQQYNEHPYSQNDVTSGSRKLLQADEQFRPLRIHVETGQVVMRNADQREFLVNALLPTAVEWLHKALAVVPVATRLVLDRDCAMKLDGIPCCPACFPFEQRTTCGQAIVPPSHLKPDGDGVAADFVLYVTTMDTRAGTLAYAMWCQEDQFNRPIAGYVNIGPNMLSLDPRLWEEQVTVSVHEMMHALGFTSKSFHKFRNRATGARWGFSNVVREVAMAGLGYTRPVLAIVTPRVVAAVRAHFGCADLEGALLENQGGDATAASHWEKRSFMEEIMTGSSSPGPVYSPITLALFEDSGWYKANYSVAEPLAWGRGAGCGLVRTRCVVGPHVHPRPVDDRYFCTDLGDDGCTHHRLAAASCFLYDYDSVPEEYRYVEGGSTGGLELADFCPVRLPHAVRGTHRTTDCRIASNAPPLNSVGEHYGPSARCFRLDGLARVGFYLDQRAGCFEYRCKAGEVHVQIGSAWVRCPEAGGPVPGPRDWVGRLMCPPATHICDDGALDRGACPGRCSGRGACLNGTCVCPPAWRGPDCQHEFCPQKYAGGACNASGGWSMSEQPIPVEAWAVYYVDRYSARLAVALLIAAVAATVLVLLISALTALLVPRRHLALSAADMEHAALFSADLAARDDDLTPHR